MTNHKLAEELLKVASLVLGEDKVNPVLDQKLKPEPKPEPEPEPVEEEAEPEAALEEEEKPKAKSKPKPKPKPEPEPEEEAEPEPEPETEEEAPAETEEQPAEEEEVDESFANRIQDLRENLPRLIRKRDYSLSQFGVGSVKSSETVSDLIAALEGVLAEIQA